MTGYIYSFSYDIIALCSIYICIHVNVDMHDIVYICLDNSEEVHRIAVPEKSELEELEQMTHSGELLIIMMNVISLNPVINVLNLLLKINHWKS